MSHFTSQPMTYCQCLMPRQISYQVISQLGQLQTCHFTNRQINYQSPYIKSFRRCDDALTKITQIHEFIHEFKPEFKLRKFKTAKEMLREFREVIEGKGLPQYLYVNEVEDEILEVHKYLIGQKKELEQQRKEFNCLIEEAALLLSANQSQMLKQMRMSQFQGQQLMLKQQAREPKNTLPKENNSQHPSQTGFQFKCYIIQSSSYLSISKSLFRISHGNIYLEQLTLPQHTLKKIFKNDPLLEGLGQKMVIGVVFQQGSSGVLLRKIQRLMKCYETSRELTVAPDKWDRELAKIQSKVKQLKSLMDLTQQSIQRYLYRLYQPKQHSSISRLKYLQSYISKQRLIYQQLCCLQPSQTFLHFSIFLPTSSLPLNIHPHPNLPPLILKPTPPPIPPPTKFTLPEILQIPQQILNTYGVPAYQEFNPAVLYLVTFGFFIGVMFGDVGHMMMAIPLLVYFRVNKWFWIVVMWMGYCGVVYNQFFGMDLGLFESCYDISSQQTIKAATRTQQHCVYPFGIDSTWKISQNSMQFTNSLKMKLAVILGVCHMLLGLAIRVINNLKQKNNSELLLQTLPQIIFMLLTFGYMDFLIIYKWLTNYTDQSQAPSIISTMIAIFVEFGGDGDGRVPHFWTGERHVEKMIVAVCVVCVPIMLLGKPLYIYLKRRNQHNYSNNGSDQALTDNNNQFDLHQQHPQSQFNKSPHTNHNSQEALSQKDPLTTSKIPPNTQNQSMKQLIVHQFIQTIEYVLGTVSNTASYLRLWALSLAHEQLSEVIFELILERQIEGGYAKIVAVLILFPVYFAVTFFVLICMDSMECFLHSLRLHWVEFQNKFYKGNGYLFEPFNFRMIHKSSQ